MREKDNVDCMKSDVRAFDSLGKVTYLSLESHIKRDGMEGKGKGCVGE